LRLSGVVVGAALAGAVPAVACAQWTVFDPTNYAENVLHYLRAVDQVANQVTALKKLQSPSYRDLTGTWGGLDGAMQGGVGYGSPGAAGTLATTYPGAVPNTAYVPERTTQVARALQTAVAVLQAAQSQGATFDAGSRQLAGMRGQTSAIHGHEEALELQTTIGVFSAQELMLARQALEAGNNLQAVALAERVNAGAQSESNARAMYEGMGGTAGVPRAAFSFRAP
jgi:type IV secretion system protein TrbJ